LLDQADAEEQRLILQHYVKVIELRAKLARHHQALLDNKRFESRAVLARFLGVGRARGTQV
jgi:hypothetical protein